MVLPLTAQPALDVGLGGEQLALEIGQRAGERGSEARNGHGFPREGVPILPVAPDVRSAKKTGAPQGA